MRPLDDRSVRACDGHPANPGRGPRSGRGPHVAVGNHGVDGTQGGDPQGCRNRQRSDALRFRTRWRRRDTRSRQRQRCERTDRGRRPEEPAHAPVYDRRAPGGPADLGCRCELRKGTRLRGRVPTRRVGAAVPRHLAGLLSLRRRRCAGDGGGPLDVAVAFPPKSRVKSRWPTPAWRRLLQTRVVHRTCCGRVGPGRSSGRGDPRGGTIAYREGTSSLGPRGSTPKDASNASRSDHQANRDQTGNDVAGGGCETASQVFDRKT